MDFCHTVDIVRHIYDRKHREYDEKIDDVTVTGALVPAQRKTS